ncbi:hypothetical protein KIW84_063248 [Lathyrus oleraceus]|uniref:DUF7745 domain-containing protein n=1 Tax=Pisum sativum TaxID=3888 RepID=A0A9D5A6J7_PEA|nr:hypothetical protein KIW84_063248 [Pisum sativum]
MPTLEEYAHLLGIPISSKVPFSGLEEIPISHLIAEALHLKKSEIETHWVKKGGMFWLTSEFLIKEDTAFAQQVVWMLLKLSLCYSSMGGINYNPALARRQLGFPLRDKPNNTQLEGLFYQEGKDPQHLKQKMVHAWHNVHKKGRSELGPRNCVALEAYTLWVKKRALDLKMPYDCERPMSMVVVEPLTLPNQDVEELEDALAKME